GKLSNRAKFLKLFLKLKKGVKYMPGKAIRKESIKKNTISDMTKLGVYKAEYDPIIDIYCEMREQYELYTKQLKDKEYKCDEWTAAGGTKKSALVSTIETLRKDILLYSDRLGLNPKTMAKDNLMPGKKKQSKLGAALSSLEKG
ncbi:MAG: terminase, partial [Clostridia bacterium]|nr:terminase [Clostridia bacterium]